MKVVNEYRMELPLFCQWQKNLDKLKSQKAVSKVKG
jgi:hypothetical protein